MPAVKFISHSVVLLISLSLLNACSGKLTPKDYIEMGSQAYSQDDCENALINFEKVIDSAPQNFTRNEYAKEIAEYQECQIIYGFKQAEEAEKSNKPQIAWFWYTLVSLVDNSSEKCKEAKEHATKIQAAYSSDLLHNALLSYQKADIEQTIELIGSSLLHGGKDDFSQLAASNPQFSFFALNSLHTPLISADIAGNVRTDSLERMFTRETYSPYGIPIYFGDIPSYYSVIGSVKVEGFPLSKKLPDEFKEHDGVYELSQLAIQHGSDAVINVHLITESRDPYTAGEMIRFLKFTN